MIEYKIFCFSGKAKIVLVCMGTAHGNQRTNDFCDLELNRLPFTSLNPNSKGMLQKPQEFETMIELAERLSSDIPEVRVDFYICNESVYFGELTFFHNSGLVAFNPDEWDLKLGEWIKLPIKRGE